MTKAILIDDDKCMVRIFFDYLKHFNVDVIGVAYNGQQAVKLYQELKPDVVLLDVIMPNYDGFYALENIRKIDSDARVIMITADLTEETAKKLAKLKASAIVYKPYEIEQVVEIIHKVMHGKTVDKLKPIVELEA